MEAEQELLKREVEELCQLVESTCTTTKGAEEFLKSHAEKVFRKLDIEKGTVSFIIIVKQDNPLGNIKTIFFNPEYSPSPLCGAEVTSENRKGKSSRYISEKTTNILREAILYTSTVKTSNEAIKKNYIPY